jgi:hypothetical protein
MREAWVARKARGDTISEEGRAKIVAAHKGVKRSPETIEKMRAAQQARRERERGDAQ